MDHIDISDLNERFKDHIDIEENLRIIFSGGFGSGKTYFFHKFFENNPDFSVVKIFPVNYSVASNEDIFEIIKFDILFELLQSVDVTFEKEYFSKLLTSQVFFEKNSNEIIKPIVENIPKIGKSVYIIADNLFNFAKKFDAFHKTVQVDKEKDSILYLKKIKKTISAIEEDAITELIRTCIETIPPEKTTVLLIDDFDRIDPDHIFRILNIFSSHFDISKDQNKFFFDKVILVCDIENIRNIFHSKYGSKIDFSGYIDKFYSRNIFRFNNNSNVEKYIQKSISLINFNEESRGALGILNKSTQYSFLIKILNDLLSRNYISLRKLINLKNLSFVKPDAIELSVQNLFLTRREYPIIAIVELLIDILGSKNLLLEAIDDLQNFKTDLESQSYYFAGLIIPLLDINQNKAERNKEFIFTDSELNVSFKYKITIDFDRRFYLADINPAVASMDGDNNFNFHQPNVLRYFYKLIRQLDGYRII